MASTPGIPSPMPNPLLALEEEALRDITWTRYTLAASLVVLFYDWLLTLGSEVELIWPARRSIVKTVFLVNRYCLPIVLIWANYAWSGHATWFKPTSCRAFIVLDSCLIIAFFASLHYIVSLRAWALYGRNKTIGVVLWGGFIIYLVSAYVITIKGLLSIPASLIPVIDICFGTLPSYLWAIWLPSIVFETLVFALTMYKAVQHSQSDLNTPIIATLYRDGFLYFLFISANSACNLVFWAVASPTKVLLIKYLSTAVTLAAGTHLILDLREVGHLSGYSTDYESGAAAGRVDGEIMAGYGYNYGQSGSPAVGLTIYQARRKSLPQRYIGRERERDRADQIRLVTPTSPYFSTSPYNPTSTYSPNSLSPNTPAGEMQPPWSMQTDELHVYPPSPQGHTPPSPGAIRFLR